jgi:hypothetical protein
MALVIQKPFAQKLLEDGHLGILKKTQSTYDKTFVNVYYKKNSFYICSVNHVSYTYKHKSLIRQDFEF